MSTKVVTGVDKSISEYLYLPRQAQKIYWMQDTKYPDPAYFFCKPEKLEINWLLTTAQGPHSGSLMSQFDEPEKKTAST